MNKNPDIINWYENSEVKQFITDRDNPNKDYHNLSLPFMGVISGSTGAGKTQFVCSLLKAFSDKRLNKKKKGTLRMTFICKGWGELIHELMHPDCQGHTKIKNLRNSKKLCVIILRFVKA